MFLRWVVHILLLYIHLPILNLMTLVFHTGFFIVPLRDSQKEQANVCSLLHIKAQILLYCNVGRKNKLCICAGRKPTRRRYRCVLYFLAATPYSTTFCCETWHNRVAEAAHAVTFDFSSGFYNRFPITGCRIRRFLCQNTSSEGFEPPRRLSSTSLVVFFMLHLSFIQRPASRDVNC